MKVKMKLNKTVFLLVLFFGVLVGQQHPRLLLNTEGAQAISQALGKYQLLDKSFEQSRDYVDSILEKEIEVPQPGEAGGYEHERHKQNYRDMQQAGVLFAITGEEKYAHFVRHMLLAYAELYPTLGPHPLAHNQAPGKLFHQMLNETVWLSYVVQAYDCIYEWLSEEDRALFEKNIFYLIAEWFTVDNASQLDRIHNHGTWSVASIGMLGLMLKDENLVDIALYGTKKDGSGGFLKQLDLLFSPDGYYMEGPYYIRYALRPFFMFAEALERNRSELKIFEYRDGILKKAHYATVQTAFPNGTFPPINDASRSMNVQAPGVVFSNDITYMRYGSDKNLLGIAKIQDQVILNRAGLLVAKDMAKQEEPPVTQWGSLEFTDGYDGKQGGLGILRSGHGSKESMLLMKYGVHGEGHGHFDKLHFIFFNQGREVVPDYGYARWVNIEPKFGGRYLPENKSYAMQTIAHNTVVVDQTTQNRSNRGEADKVWGKRHFFDASNPNIQAMSARADEHYPGIDMQRTMFLVNDPRLDFPVIVDLFRLQSSEKHTYDYPLHYRGQMITTNFEYQPHTDMLKPLGDDFGYQHIWNEAESDVKGNIRLTWLDGNAYYTFITSEPNARIFMGRTGASDPNFSLRSEPMLLLRTEGKSHLFASLIEPHGYYNEAQEKSLRARGQIEQVNVIGHNEKGSVVEVKGKGGIFWLVMVTNGENNPTQKHKLTFDGTAYEWTGNFEVRLDAR